MFGTTGGAAYQDYGTLVYSCGGVKNYDSKGCRGTGMSCNSGAMRRSPGLEEQRILKVRSKVRWQFCAQSLHSLKPKPHLALTGAIISHFHKHTIIFVKAESINKIMSMNKLMH